MGSYRKTHDPQGAYLVNKGSEGREEKLTFFPDLVEHAFSRYIRGEGKNRIAWRTQLATLDDTGAVFLVRGGHPLSDAAFRAAGGSLWNGSNHDTSDVYSACPPTSVRNKLLGLGEGTGSR